VTDFLALWALQVVQLTGWQVEAGDWRVGELSPHIHDEEFQKLAERVDVLARELEEHPDPETREKALELLQTVLSLYGEAWRRILHIVQSRRAGQEVVGQLIVSQMMEDPVVSSVLMIHGLYPVELKARVATALDQVRPYLHSQGGDAQLLGVENGVAKVRLVRPSHGSSSIAPMRLPIEKALLEAAPDLKGIEIIEGEGGVAPPSAPRSAGLLQIQIKNKVTPQATARGGTTLGLLEEFPRGTMKAMEARYGTEAVGGRLTLLICNVDGKLFAYRNACACHGLPFDKGLLEGALLTCPRNGYRYDLRRSGACLNDPALHLDPFPLLVEDGVVKVALE